MVRLIRVYAAGRFCGAYRGAWVSPARARAKGGAGRQQVRTERIVEEDEGWDLLDEDFAK